MPFRQEAIEAKLRRVEESRDSWRGQVKDYEELVQRYQKDLKAAEDDLKAARQVPTRRLWWIAQILALMFIVGLLCGAFLHHQAYPSDHVALYEYGQAVIERDARRDIEASRKAYKSPQQRARARCAATCGEAGVQRFGYVRENNREACQCHRRCEGND